MNRATLIGTFLCTLVPCRVLCSQAPLATHAPTVYIGFLDDAREVMANWEPGVARERLIRPAFEKIGSSWRPVAASSIPARMTWTVAFDGRNLGQVESASIPDQIKHGKMDRTFLTFVQMIVTPSAAVPSVGVPSSRFAGLIAMGPGKVRRPLVVVSKPYVSDPDEWKCLSHPPDRIAGLVLRAFRRDFQRVDRCKDEAVVQHGWRFPDSSLNFPVSYVSNRESFLVESHLDAGDCGYVDDPNDPLSDPWFFVSADGRVQRIGSFMSLLDVGDYDHEGHSDLIFFLSQPEDTDGFILFDADLHRQASLIWSYH